METKRLQQFKAIIDAGGLVRASDLLGISAGGLSKSMKVLEEDLGFRLFDQRGRGLELTPAGRKLYDRVPVVLQTVDDLLHFRQETVLATEAPLRITSFEVFTTYFLGSILGRRELRNRRFDIREAIPGQMEKLVAEGNADLGITYLPIPHADVDFIKVARVRMGVFALKAFVKGRALEELPFVVPIAPLQGSPSGVQGLDGWPEHLFARRVHYRVEIMESALQLCRSGTAAAFLPEFVVRLANQQTIEELRLTELSAPKGIPPVSRDVYLIQKKGVKESKELREIAKALRALD